MIYQYGRKLEIFQRNYFISILGFWYDFTPPEHITVNEEYLIYDTIGMVGSVGGTLGT